MKRLVMASLLFGSLLGCKETASQTTPEYTLEKDQIVVREGSPFLQHLEITHAKETPRGDIAFKSVGQIIALANTSGVLSNSQVSWVELDPQLTKAAGLSLAAFAGAPVGTALGVTSIPSEYIPKLQLGQSLEIFRYGLKKSDVPAVIIKIENRDGDASSSYVTFKIPRGQDWYPGTNCEVRFPLLHVQTSQVPTTAVLHEGMREYVLKEISPRHYRLAPVVIVDESPDMAQVFGVNAGEAIVGSGAILLKPEIHNFISEPAKKAAHELR